MTTETSRDAKSLPQTTSAKDSPVSPQDPLQSEPSISLDPTLSENTRKTLLQAVEFIEHWTDLDYINKAADVFGSFGIFTIPLFAAQVTGTTDTRELAKRIRHYTLAENGTVLREELLNQVGKWMDGRIIVHDHITAATVFIRLAACEFILDLSV